jgi:hypothetical protein
MPSDCNDNNACTTETCAGGICGHTPIEGCTPCGADPNDCNDHNGCTTDTCSEGVCVNAPIEGCVSCTTAAECDDNNGCTNDVCDPNEVCQHEPREGCIPCEKAADCDDQNPCTNDACAADGSCQITAIPGCQRCETATDCDDHDNCTLESCTGGVCSHSKNPQCDLTPEVCDNGKDDDGDGLIDCADPDCANAPNCVHEICGNCIDDDHNGLVDYEDPACCADGTAWMAVKKLMLRPTVTIATAKIHGNRIRLRTRYSTMGLTVFDPSTQDTSIQISDSEGTLFCTTIAASHWKHPRKRLYRFSDKKGTFAGGLRKGRFKVMKSGKVLFSTRGKKMSLRSTDGHAVRITVRVGSVCGIETKNLRVKKKALVFP